MADKTLLDVAGRIADGQAVDWPSMTPTLGSDEERALADELQVLARVAAGHRALHDVLPVQDDGESLRSRSRWGHLELLNVVGRGSYGTVYRAWDTRLERLVALKLFHRAKDAEAVMHEGRMLARIRHEHVVIVHGADVIDGVAGLWMEFLHGPTLDEIVRTERLTPREAARIGRDVADALAAIHGTHLLHCDIKAQNVVREGAGRAVLMDMGAGRVVAETRDADHVSDVAGTPRYMAPELFQAGAIATHATDMYSLGVLLYYLVSGQYPVDGKSIGELRQAHIDGGAVPLRTVRQDLPAAYLALVESLLDQNPAERPASASVVRAWLDAIAHPRAGRIWKWTAAAAAVTALTLIAWSGPRWWSAATPTRTIAVLPIKNLTGDPAKNYVADGLTEVLIANLARIRALRVPSFAAVAPVRTSTDRPDELAKKLGVELLLAGSIVEVGDRFRMAVQLIDPRTGAAVWGEEVSRDPAGMLAAQAEIARMVAAHLQLSLSAAEERGLSQSPIAPQAQDAFLAGMAYTLSTPAKQNAAAERFRRAVEIDPGFAAAWGQLALAELVLVDQSVLAERQARAALIKQLAERAIVIDPSLAAGHAAIGSVNFYHEWDFAGAERTFRKALDSDPSSAFARQRFSMFLAAMGRLDEAIAIGREAEVLEPLLAQRAASLGMLYYYARDYTKASSQMDRAIGLAPESGLGYFGHGRILSAQGDHPRALVAYEEALARSRVSIWLVEEARAYAAAGQRAETARVLAEVFAREKAGEGYGLDNLGFIAAAEGRLDDAFRILNDAVDRRLANILWLKVDPRADPLRSDPRFETLLARIGLPR